MTSLYRSIRTGIATAIVMLLVLPGVPGHANIDAETLSTPSEIEAFSLADHDKRPFGPERLHGQWTLILLGFTHCPDVCPFTLNNLVLVMEQLKFQVSPERLPRLVFVGVDPDRDEDVIADYVAHFDPDILGVTGEWDEIRKLVESLDGFVRIDKDATTRRGDGYQVRHSSRVSVIDPRGRIVARINPPMDPSETAIFIATLMRDYRQRNSTDDQ